MIVSTTDPLVAVIGCLGFLFDGERLYMRAIGRSKFGAHMIERKKWLKRQQKRRRYQREQQNRRRSHDRAV